jgi:hypothetical protein
MAGPPVSIGAMVVVTPGAAGPPDTGTITVILPPFVTANGLPLATSGSICTMINSLSGIPYPLVIGPLGSSGAGGGPRPGPHRRLHPVTARHPDHPRPARGPFRAGPVASVGEWRR